MTNPASAIVRDPDWLAHRYDPGNDAVHFLRVPREHRARATFLTDQHLGAEPAPVVLRRGDATAAVAQAAPVHFVFHAAFCCSTLIARALDRAGCASTLKEPVVLNDIVGWRRRGATAEALRPVLDDTLTLLARPFGPGEAVVVKPSNAVNGFAMEMMARRPAARALLMYAPLPEFLASIAKKGLDGRVFARDLFLHVLKDGLVRARFDSDQLLQQTDLQIAAMGWLAQIDLFRAMTVRFGPDRARTIDSETLLAQPDRAMAGIVRLFGLTAGADAIAAMAGGPAFTTHSKTGSRFGVAGRRAEQAGAMALFADEIAKVVEWTRTIAAGAGIAMAPGGALLP
jgi:hypothetical protein